MPIRQLESFIAEIRDRREEEMDRLPERCPHDGIVLDLVTRDDGVTVLHCRAGNYTLEV